MKEDLSGNPVLSCNPVNGQCDCKYNFYGQHCDDCYAGYFGPNCSGNSEYRIPYSLNHKPWLMDNFGDSFGANEKLKHQKSY